MKNGKRIIAFVLTLAVALTCLPCRMEVRAAKLGDLEYEVNSDGESVTITDYPYDASGGNIVIPSEIEGKKVTAIGKSAFYGCENITGITLPETVTSIGDFAFSGCENLRSIVIPDAVTDIGMLAFDDAGLLSVTIPANVSSIGELAFNRLVIRNIKVAEGNKVYDSRNDCNAIIETATDKLVCATRNTVMPNNVKIIGKYAFYNCIGMNENLVIPSSVTKIEERAFSSNSLRNVVIPGSVTVIDEKAFYYCSNLKSVTISEGVKTIGRYAFFNVDLKDVTIPNSVTEIGIRAFGWEHSDRDGEVKTPGFIIYGNVGTAAETYAKDEDNLFPFKNPSEKPDDKPGDNPNDKPNDKPNEQPPRITCSKKNYEVAYSKGKSFTIAASANSKLSYTSSDRKVAVVDVNTGKVTLKGYGVATITVKAGNENVKVTVKVIPKKQTVKSVKAVKGRKLSVKWVKDKMASGYQVQLSTTKNFKKITQNKKINKNKTYTSTFTKLKKGKKYYVRVRSFKKSAGGTVYSAWTKGKLSAKVKR